MAVKNFSKLSKAKFGLKNCSDASKARFGLIMDIDNFFIRGLDASVANILFILS